MSRLSLVTPSSPTLVSRSLYVRSRSPWCSNPEPLRTVSCSSMDRTLVAKGTTSPWSSEMDGSCFSMTVEQVDKFVPSTPFVFSYCFLLLFSSIGFSYCFLLLFSQFVFFYCFLILFSPIVFSFCFLLLFSPIVFSFCFLLLFSPIVFSYCFLLLFSPFVFSYWFLLSVSPVVFSYFLLFRILAL